MIDMKRIAIIMIGWSLLLLVGCSWWDMRAYYEKHPMTVEDLGHRKGQIPSIEILEDGTERWTYSYRNNSYFSESWYLIRDGRVIDSGAR